MVKIQRCLFVLILFSLSAISAGDEKDLDTLLAEVEAAMGDVTADAVVKPASGEKVAGEDEGGALRRTSSMSTSSTAMSAGSSVKSPTGSQKSGDEDLMDAIELGAAVGKVPELRAAAAKRRDRRGSVGASLALGHLARSGAMPGLHEVDTEEANVLFGKRFAEFRRRKFK